ncbi:reverse transcriptase domain-containing protein [Tanacetum coccineum]
MISIRGTLPKSKLSKFRYNPDGFRKGERVLLRAKYFLPLSRREGDRWLSPEKRHLAHATRKCVSFHVQSRSRALIEEYVGSLMYTVCLRPQCVRRMWLENQPSQNWSKCSASQRSISAKGRRAVCCRDERSGVLRLSSSSLVSTIVVEGEGRMKRSIREERCAATSQWNCALPLQCHRHRARMRVCVVVLGIFERGYAPKLLGFPSDDFSSNNPTSTSEPFTSEFTLEEIDAYLCDKSISLESDHDDCDPEEDIYVLEQLLNDDPFQLPLMDLKQSEVTEAKSSIEEPLELELKDLPSHLEYAYLEENDKLPVIIAKGLKNDQKEALINVLKSHKRAIAWKITDIKGIDPRFCTHKILMEDDCKPSVQSQRRVNPKIHEVIKKEVIKLLDAEMIYSISDSPWVSPIHCVPKKGGMAVVANEENELIPTRLVTGWRVCIDYRKLNEATRKDHFPLPFMDQMLERLAGNEFYCFLDGFSGYFQIPIDPHDQEKMTFTCPYGTFAYRRMPFGLCNAPGTFQRCMMGDFLR